MLSGFQKLALKCTRLGEHYNTGTTNPHPYTPYKAKCIHHWGTNCGCWDGVAPQPPPEAQAVPGSIPDVAPFLSIVDFQCFVVRLSKVGAKVHQAGEHYNTGTSITHPYTPCKAKCIQYIIMRTE